MTRKELAHKWYLKNKERWKQYRQQGNFNLNKRKQWMKEYNKKYREENKEYYQKYSKEHHKECYYKYHEKNKKSHREWAYQKCRKQGKLRREEIRGENHWHWKGGISPLYEMIRKSAESKLWKEQVFKRDNFTCRKCRQVGGDAEAHHLKRFSVILKEFIKEYNQFSPLEEKEILLRLAFTYKPFWDLDNGITLCKKCHDRERKKDKSLIHLQRQV